MTEPTELLMLRASCVLIADTCGEKAEAEKLLQRLRRDKVSYPREMAEIVGYLYDLTRGIRE